MTKREITLLDIGSGMMAALASYSDELVKKMRTIPRAHWNPKALRWEFPSEKLGIFRQLFSEWLIVAPAVRESACKNDPVADLAKNLACMKDALQALKYSHRTVRRYLSIIDRYARFIEVPLHESSASDATRFLAHLERDVGSSASTINQAISAIRFLYIKVLGKEAPLARRPKADRRLPGILSREETARILSAPCSLKHRALLAIAYSAGLRVSEIAELRISDVDQSRGVIFVRRGKGRKDRYTILAAKTNHLLKAYLRLYKPKIWLFEGKDGHHITIRTIQEVFYRARDRAKIDKAVSIHSLRHSFATHLLENGTDIRYIQELLGHANAKTTQIYTHVAQKDFLRIRSPYDQGKEG
jgi:integrase/recombinase XerD